MHNSSSGGGMGDLEGADTEESLLVSALEVRMQQHCYIAYCHM